MNVKDLQDYCGEEESVVDNVLETGGKEVEGFYDRRERSRGVLQKTFTFYFYSD